MIEIPEGEPGSDLRTRESLVQRCQFDDAQVRGLDFTEHAGQEIAKLSLASNIVDVRFVLGPDGVPIDATESRIVIVLVDGGPDGGESVVKVLRIAECRGLSR